MSISSLSSLSSDEEVVYTNSQRRLTSGRRPAKKPPAKTINNTDVSRREHDVPTPPSIGQGQENDEEVVTNTNSRTRKNLEKLEALKKFDDTQFKMLFRLDKATVLYLCSLVGESLQPVTRRNRAIQPVDQLLIALRFFATGSDQKVIADMFKVEQPTVHRIVHRVALELSKLEDKFIKMPTASEQLQIAHEFYGIAGFSNVIGAVGCTHIKIKSPGGVQGKSYKNSKGFFSINVQMVCDTSLRVSNIIAKWPGSFHESTIFGNSPLCAQFEQGDYKDMFLLGDSSYPCCQYLLTPLQNPSTPAEEAYNRALISTRSPIERLFTELKKRFPCLQIGLQMKIENIPAIIVACTVLHNIAVSRQDFMEDMELEATEMPLAQEATEMPLALEVTEIPSAQESTNPIEQMKMFVQGIPY